MALNLSSFRINAATAARSAAAAAVILGGAAFAAHAETNQSAPQKVAAKFTSDECTKIARLLLSEMKSYHPDDDSPDNAITRVLPDSSKAFIGLDRTPKVMACDGPLIQWSTKGEKYVLDSLMVQMEIAEKYKTIPKGLADRFRASISSKAKSLSTSSLRDGP